jgi:cytochrome c oxidase assembly protein subunit 15
VVAGRWTLPQGFTLLRELGHTATARCCRSRRWWPSTWRTAVCAGAPAGRWPLAWALWRSRRRLRPQGAGLAALLLAQLASGLSNVVLGWPLVAALAHSAGAAALVLVLTLLLARRRPRSPPAARAVRVRPPA